MSDRESLPGDGLLDVNEAAGLLGLKPKGRIRESRNRSTPR
jgi:hypothetical protein